MQEQKQKPKTLGGSISIDLCELLRGLGGQHEPTQAARQRNVGLHRAHAWGTQAQGRTGQGTPVVGQVGRGGCQ